MSRPRVEALRLISRSRTAHLRFPCPVVEHEYTVAAPYRLHILGKIGENGGGAGVGRDRAQQAAERGVLRQGGDVPGGASPIAVSEHRGMPVERAALDLRDDVGAGGVQVEPFGPAVCGEIAEPRRRDSKLDTILERPVLLEADTQHLAQRAGLTAEPHPLTGLP